MSRKATLVSLYGPKRDAEFAKLVKECQNAVKADIPGFIPYDMKQIHATIIGLEHQDSTDQKIGPFLNDNFKRLRKQNTEMDLDGLFLFLRNCGLFPLEVQIGGFENREYPFRSRDTQPSERTFSIQNDRVVLMGWPVRGKPLLSAPQDPLASLQEARLYPSTLDMIRHAAQRYGVLHGYHGALTDVDNDLFFRIGLIGGALPTARKLRAVERTLRDYLSSPPPLIIEIRLNDVRVAVYDDNTLPTATTKHISLNDPLLTQQWVVQQL